VKVGDLVKQSDTLVKLNGKHYNKRKKMIGIVLAVKENTFPEGWEASEYQLSWADKLGRRIDVLWPSGKITKNFAENSLEVIIDRST
jgi:hypothetical protein